MELTLHKPEVQGSIWARERTGGIVRTELYQEPDADLDEIIKGGNVNS